ncbi:cupredoxin family protein [Pseudomonas sp. GD04058]|uniref:cupredoxin domain-containing protein n=1 Tax=Pseudomonas sp. GD04058 TaxID=2975429 RepID=UPI002447A2C0|nr:cupredoxin family protein [Pseudomonas sp. GD04058]MDG9884516.1 cupredoxin family protein [Pseudomonas sp. GD04058]
MKRALTTVLLTLLSLPALAAPGQGFAFGQPAPAAKATRTVEVTLGDMYFEPRTLEVKAGETVRFVVINKGQVAHEFNLGDTAMHTAHQKEMLAMAQMDHSKMGHGDMNHGMQHDDPNTVLVQPGQRGELTWTFSNSAPIEFACNVPGHYQAGMVGTLNIAR